MTKMDKRERAEKQNDERIFHRQDQPGVLSSPVQQVLSPEWNRFSMDVVDYLEERPYGVVYDEPQALWTKGCPLGNGDLGALVYGAPEALHFCLGKTDLWDYRPFGEAMRPPVSFNRLREIIKTGNHSAFEEAAAEERRQARQRPVITGKPGGMLRLELFGPALPSKYRQRLSLAHAECNISWTAFGYVPNVSGNIEVMSFIHSACNVLAIQVRADMAGGWGDGLRFSLWRDRDPAVPPAECHTEGDYNWLSQELPGGEYYILMTALSDSGIPVNECLGRLEGKGVPAGGEISLYVTLVTSRESKDPLGEAKDNLAAVKRAGWERLRESHRRWWHDFWRRGYVATPFETMEKYWYYALYLQASTCRPGRLSPGLQGNWIKENYPAWNADFHHNFNMQVLNWGHYTANRLELGEPMYRLLLDVLERCRKDTNEYFGLRGVRYPLSMGPDGAETCPVMLLSVYIGAGGWLVQHLWWHYRMTGDRDFLRNCAWPVLRECALFYLDYLIKESDGTYTIFPSLHAETVCNRIAGAGRNATWDMAIITRCFQMALAAAEELGEAPESQAGWREALAHLSPIPTNADGVWLEWSDRGGLLHMDNSARMMPIFPAELVSADSGPEQLREQARRTIDEYWKFQPRPYEVASSPCGFCGIMMAVALFRMGMVERGLQVAEHVCRMLNPSGFVTGKDAHYFQADTPPGLSLLLNEMLLQSHDGILRIFPAVPVSSEPIRFHSLRAQGGFLVSAERRENRTMYVIVHSLCGQELRLRNPFKSDSGVEVKVYLLPQQEDVLESGEKQGAAIPWRDEICLPGQIIRFQTSPGQVYLISKEIPWVSNIPRMPVLQTATQKKTV